MTLTNDHRQPAAAAAAAAVPPKTDKDTGYEGWDNLGKWDVLSGDQWSSLRGQLDVIMLRAASAQHGEQTTGQSNRDMSREPCQ